MFSAVTLPGLHAKACDRQNSKRSYSLRLASISQGNTPVPRSMAIASACARTSSLIPCWRL